MKKTEQRKIVNTLIKEIRADLLDNSDKWPEEWDGHELKELVASKFERERGDLMADKRKARVKDYVRTVAQLGL